MALADTSTKSNSSTPINKVTFETIYERYWEKVYAICYNNIKESEVAKELVQDIFKSLWERRDKLELTTVENYLARSAKFKTFEYIRNKVNRQRLLENTLHQCPLATNCTEDRIVFSNLLEKVNMLIEKLPCQCKKVFKMSREEGLTNKQIASILLISERAVEYHITRALSSLKNNIPTFRS